MASNWKSKFKISGVDQQTIADIGKVPNANGHDLKGQRLAGSIESVKAVIQFTTSDFPVGGQQRIDCRRWTHKPYDHGFEFAPKNADARRNVPISQRRSFRVKL